MKHMTRQLQGNYKEKTQQQYKDVKGSQRGGLEKIANKKEDIY